MMTLRTSRPVARRTTFALAGQFAIFFIATGALWIGASATFYTQDWAQDAPIERTMESSVVVPVNDARGTLRFQRDPILVPETAQLAEPVSP